MSVINISGVLYNVMSWCWACLANLRDLQRWAIKTSTRLLTSTRTMKEYVRSLQKSSTSLLILYLFYNLNWSYLNHEKLVSFKNLEFGALRRLNSCNNAVIKRRNEPKVSYHSWSDPIQDKVFRNYMRNGHWYTATSK